MPFGLQIGHKLNRAKLAKVSCKHNQLEFPESFIVKVLRFAHAAGLNARALLAKALFDHAAGGQHGVRSMH